MSFDGSDEGRNLYWEGTNKRGAEGAKTETPKGDGRGHALPNRLRGQGSVGKLP